MAVASCAPSSGAAIERHRATGAPTDRDLVEQPDGMSFSRPEYFLFLPLVVGVYYCLPFRLQNDLFLAASLAKFDSPSDDERYLTVVRLLSSEYALPFWDPDQPPQRTVFTAIEFADSNHLSRRGAAVLSAYLARRYMDLSSSPLVSGVP